MPANRHYLRSRTTGAANSEQSNLREGAQLLQEETDNTSKNRSRLKSSLNANRNDRGCERDLVQESVSSCPSVETAPCESTDSSLSVSSRTSQASVKSCPAAPTTSNSAPPVTQPLSTLSLLPRSHRCNLLQTLVRAFPVTIPTEDFVNFMDSQERPYLTNDMKRYFAERKGLHRNQFAERVSVFKAERPWEPKWFTNFLSNLVITTKARPNIYQFVFETKKRDDENVILQRWQTMSIYVKWSVLSLSVLLYLFALCLWIEIFGEEGVNVAVPLTLFLAIIFNKVLMEMTSSLPS